MNSLKDELQRLNDKQYEAVVHEGGPLFVVAGAGTGKTKTLTTRIAYLIKDLNVNPDKILGVTFTNKAAREIKERVNNLVRPNKMGSWLYTFHAFGLRILRSHAVNLNLGYDNDFTVIDEDDVLSIIREIIKKRNIDNKRYPPRVVRAAISDQKTMILDIVDKVIDDIYEDYKIELVKNQLMDFDDLICYTYSLFRDNKVVREKFQNQFEHILIDEFQDTDKIQYGIIRLLNNKNTFVVGDPDQSIYAFRGARYENNDLFVKEFNAKTIVLDKNYRSTNNILTAANSLIAKNRSRTTEKNLVSDYGDGMPVNVYYASDDFDEVNMVTTEITRLVNAGYHFDDIAVLYRNNYLSRLFEHSFSQNQIPYIIYGGISFYERKEIKDILAYLRLIIDQDNGFYFKRVVNVPSRGIGNVTVEKLEAYADYYHVSMFEAIDKIEFPSRTLNSLKEFKKLIIDLREQVINATDLVSVIDLIFYGSGYNEELKKDIDDKAKERKDNIFELKNVLRQADWKYEGTNIEKIKSILDEIALYTDHDKNLSNGDVVKLASVHQVKGLEFKVVFVIAVEDGIFPGDRAFDSSFELEEERRVFYVALTRAKERLTISHAQRRMMYGQIKNSNPSRFIQETKVFKKEQANNSNNISSKNFSSTNNDYSVGDVVVHSVFGKGVVVEIKEGILTIAFTVEHGIKKIASSFNGIKKVN
ncbi:MAG: 3'-5' exonuclease [Acholeplasma sp.]|nr:3'-5' exonuclease [Acholeplasma sp.]